MTELQNQREENGHDRDSHDGRQVLEALDLLFVLAADLERVSGREPDRMASSLGLAGVSTSDDSTPCGRKCRHGDGPELLPSRKLLRLRPVVERREVTDGQFLTVFRGSLRHHSDGERTPAATRRDHDGRALRPTDHTALLRDGGAVRADGCLAFKVSGYVAKLRRSASPTGGSTQGSNGAG